MDVTEQAVAVARIEDCSLSQLERLRPALLLVDASSVPATRLVDALGVNGSVILAHLATHLVVYGLAENDEAAVLDYAALGAKGFLLSDAAFEELRDAVCAVLAGEVRCPPKIAGVLLRTVGHAAKMRVRIETLGGLTRREREALLLCVAEQSYKQIASRMGIEEGTVKQHIHSAYRKLGVTSRRAAARLIDLGVEIGGGADPADPSR